MITPRIRPARIEEAQSLTELAMRSKAYWGYDASFMAQCADALTVHDHQIEAGLIMVATDQNDTPIGSAGIAMTDPGTADLCAMFVDPPHIGKGLGQPLFEAACQIAKDHGAKRLTILSDPGARGFYEHMGAKYIGHEPSDAIPGRLIPWLIMELQSKE